MARRARHAPLTVVLNGRRVGELLREASGAVAFTYAAEWLAWDQAFAISLALPLGEGRYAGAPVFAVFDNLLPDNPAVRQRVAERVGARGQDAYSLLAAIGRDCVGALQFLPAGVAPVRPGPIDAQPLDEDQIAGLLANLARAPLGLGDDMDFRISLAGVQEKTALLHHEGCWWLPRGATPTTHILKPPIGEAGGIDLSTSVENEFLCMKLTGALGLRVAGVEMVRFGARRVLVVERFDRTLTRDGRWLRLPQEDMCQALSCPPALKYESDGGPGAAAIMKVLGGADDPLADRRAFMRALIVFWLLGATDGHAKNFSLQLGAGGGYRLAPLYDILSVQPLVDARQLEHRRFRLSMAVGEKRHYAMGVVAPRHFIQTAKAAGMTERFVLEDMRELAANAEAAVALVLADLPADYPIAIADSITGGLRRRLQTLIRYLDAADGAG